MCTRGDAAEEARTELRVRHKLNSRLFTIYGALQINFLYFGEAEFTELDLLVQNFVPSHAQTVFPVWLVPHPALVLGFTPFHRPPFCLISSTSTTGGT